MDREQFIAYCTGELNKVYNQRKSGRPDDKAKYRTEGLFQAAKLLGYLSDAEIADLFEREHINVFGESISERKQRLDAYADLKEHSLESYLDIPAIERKR